MNPFHYNYWLHIGRWVKTLLPKGEYLATKVTWKRKKNTLNIKVQAIRKRPVEHIVFRFNDKDPK